jgi:hypothetical protein
LISIIKELLQKSSSFFKFGFVEEIECNIVGADIIRPIANKKIKTIRYGGQKIVGLS